MISNFTNDPLVADDGFEPSSSPYESDIINQIYQSAITTNNYNRIPQNCQILFYFSAFLILHISVTVRIDNPKNYMKICVKCQREFLPTKVIDGKRRNLSGRKFCLECSPFGSHNTKDITKYQNYVFEKDGYKYKKCPQCQSVLELNNENYYMRKNGSFHYYCKKCLDKKSLNQKRMLKKKAVDYKGGKCSKCSYNRCLGALEFHHIDPTKKDFTITSFRTYNWNKIRKELDKCICVCANCHREIEYPL